MRARVRNKDTHNRPSNSCARGRTKVQPHPHNSRGTERKKGRLLFPFEYNGPIVRPIGRRFSIQGAHARRLNRLLFESRRARDALMVACARKREAAWLAGCVYVLAKKQVGIIPLLSGRYCLLQVLFLTASTEPYKAGRPFVRFHDKFIIVPAADYGTAYLAYKKPLMSHAAIDRHLDVSCLAKLAAGVTPHETIRQAVDRAAPIARRMDFKRRPLKQPEILEKVLEVATPSGKDLEDFDKFWGKLWPEKKRRELERERLAAAAVEKEKKDKKKK